MKSLSEKQVSQIEAGLDSEERRNYREHFIALFPRNDIVKELFQKWMQLPADVRVQIRDLILSNILSHSSNYESIHVYNLVYYLMEAMNYWSKVQDSLGACGIDPRSGNMTPRTEHELYRVTTLLNRGIHMVIEQNQNRSPGCSSNNNSRVSLNQSQAVNGRGDGGILAGGTMCSKVLSSFDCTRQRLYNTLASFAADGAPKLKRKLSGTSSFPASGDCNNNRDASYAAFCEYSGQGVSDTPSSSGSSESDQSGTGSACEIEDESTSGSQSEDDSKPPKYFFVPTPSPSPSYDC